MKRFGKWLLPVAIISLLLATLVGGSCAPQSLGEALDPSGNPFAHRFSDVTDIRAATFVVAASDSEHKFEADYMCDGTNDHIQVQAALDALPATGGSVELLDGTYNVEVQIDLDSNQTLRGCGRNTILTTSTFGVTFLSVVGGSSTEKTHIIIADLQIDGASNALIGIYFEYVDYSLIQNVYLKGHVYTEGVDGLSIYLLNSDFNKIMANTCQGDNIGWKGIYLNTCNNNTIVGNTCRNIGPEGDGIFLSDSDFNEIIGNTCQGSGDNGISLQRSDNNTIVANICSGNIRGILLYRGTGNTVTGNINQGNFTGIEVEDTSGNTISSNICQENLTHGIMVNETGAEPSNNNTIVGNTCIANSQNTDNTSDDIYVAGDSNYNNIQGNTCRAGALENKPRYGINVSAATCDGNLVTNNDLYDDGFGTAPFNDVGTGTKLNVYVVSFSDGTDPQDSGFLIDAGGDMARTWMRLPDEVVQVVRMNVYARSVVAEADSMRLEFVIYGGADNEVYTTHNGSVADHPSTSSNFAADDVIYWTITEAGALALTGGDSIEIQILYEDAGGADCATDAYIRTVEIEYV